MPGLAAGFRTVTPAAATEPCRLLLIRHGETDWNVGQRIQGQLDIELNEAGRWQAARLAEALRGQALDAVYSSDLRRAHLTALALSAAGQPAPTLLPTLRERHFGVFQGLSWDEIAAHHPAEHARWKAREPGFGPPGGETLQAFDARVLAAVGGLAADHPGQAVAVVAHGGVLDCLYRAAARLPLEAPRSWTLPNTGVGRLLHGPEGFTLLGWADTRHLDGPGQDDASVGPAA